MGKGAILVSLPIHEHGLSPLILEFFNVFQQLFVLSVGAFISLVIFIPKYFVLYDATVNGIKKIFFSDFLWLLNTTDFCILILYPTTLLNLFIRTSSLHKYCISFSYLTALHRISNTMLHKSSESRHPILPDHIGKVFILPSSMVFELWFFIDVFY